jgi:hypothetical protein
MASAAPVALIAASPIKLHMLISRSPTFLDGRAKTAELDKARLKRNAAAIFVLVRKRVMIRSQGCH